MNWDQAARALFQQVRNKHSYGNISSKIWNRAEEIAWNRLSESDKRMSREPDNYYGSDSIVKEADFLQAETEVHKMFRYDIKDWGRKYVQLTSQYPGRAWKETKKLRYLKQNVRVVPILVDPKMGGG